MEGEADCMEQILCLGKQRLHLPEGTGEVWENLKSLENKDKPER